MFFFAISAGLLNTMLTSATDPQLYEYSYPCNDKDASGHNICICHYVDDGREIVADCSGSATLHFILWEGFTDTELERLSTIFMSFTPF